VPRTRRTASRGPAAPTPFLRERPQLSEPHRHVGRTLIAAVLPLLLVGALGWLWFASLVPSTYSVMEMGHAEYGGGPAVAHQASHVDGVSVADLTGPSAGRPDVAVTLTARRQQFRLASGERVDGYTLNGASPGPTIRVRQGDLLEVTLVNGNVEEGVTLHWHGVDVPNAEDGVAGVTQDAVAEGGRYVYRFVVPDAGTYWYHSHQVSHRQVRGGLFGVLVADPAEEAATPDGPRPPPTDVLAAVHTYDGIRTVNGRSGVSRARVPPGVSARVRIVNTENGRVRLWVSGTTYRVLAVDGRDLHRPTDVRGKSLVVPAGGRADLLLTVPDRGVRLDLGGGTALVLGPAGAWMARGAGGTEPPGELDLLTYGASAPPPFDARRADRTFDYRIGRRPGFVDGRPGFWWSINGKLFPDVPMYVVEEGDVVRMRISNNSGDVHPMHLHGHHALVLSRNGVRSSGSPWWVDSLDVEDGETFEIAFLADNPGVWMDHCHNLAHAAEGLVAHLAYAGVTEPFLVGREIGGAHNAPE